MKIRIPLDFNLEEHLKKYPLEEGEIKKLDKDRLLYAVGLPITIRANNKDLRTWGGWVPVNAKTLMAMIGNGYKGYLDYFVRTGVLETANSQYIVGAQSILYRHTEAYRGDYRLVELGRKFKAKLAKAKRREMKELFTKPEYSKLKHLYEWFGTGKLELDIDAVREYLYSTLLKGKVRLRENDLYLVRKKAARISQHKKTGKGEKERLSTRDKLLNKYYSTLMAAERVADKDYFFKMDDKAGRVHTSMSNLKKELRNFLTYYGKNLVEVDIKNSQPFFSLALFNKAFFSIEKMPQEKNFDTNSISYSKDIRETIQREDTITFKGMYLQHVFQHDLYEGLHQTSSLVMVYSMIEDIDNKDISHYRDKVLEGIYEHLLERYIENTGRVDMDRNDMKKVMFTILFSMNEKEEINGESYKEMIIRKQREIAKDTFRSCFPKVMEVFEFFKEDNHRLLACLLQSIEAHVVLNKICGRIKRERPGMPLFTVHDSIMTTVGNEFYLKKVIEEECLKNIGVIPKLDINYLHPDKLALPQKKAA